jgi:hypothetical protein
MQFKTSLKAGVAVPLDIRGKMFVVVGASVVTVLKVQVKMGSTILEEFETSRRFSIKTESGFDKIVIQPAADVTLDCLLSDGTVEFDFADGINVNATITNVPLQVVPDRGAPGNPVYVSGITYADAPATAFEEPAAVVVPAAVLTALLAANANRKTLKITNLGPDPVAVGGAGLTWAKRCIVLQVGDTWVEERGANLAWSAITDAAKTATVTVQGVLA